MRCMETLKKAFRIHILVCAFATTPVIADDLNTALQLLKAKLLQLANKLSAPSSSSYFSWLKIREQTPELKGSFSQYYFGQQENSTCMIWPWINLKILESIQKECPDFKNIQAKWWAAHRTWFGREFTYVVTWNKAFQEVAKHNFFTKAVTEGPVTPHFYKEKNTVPLYLCDENNNKLYYLEQITEYENNNFYVYHFDNPTSLISSILNLEVLPYFAGDRELDKTGFKDENDSIEDITWTTALDLLGSYQTTLPMGTGNEDLAFNPAKDAWESCSFIGTMSDWYINVIKNSTQQNIYKKMALWNNKKFGFNSIYGNAEADFLAFDRNGKKYSIYTVGLYKLILLRLGLDHDNNVVTQENDTYGLWDIVSTLKNKYNEGDPTQNAWSDIYMSKEVFLEYWLAEFFKSNEGKILFNQAQQNNKSWSIPIDEQGNTLSIPCCVVDFILAKWSMYQNILDLAKQGQLTGKGGNAALKYDSASIQKYLPGPEQMMAMTIMQKVQFLWWGAISEEAFYKATTKKIEIWTFDLFKGAAQEVGFLDFWKNLLSAFKNWLKTKNITREHFVSFVSHGWIASFNATLINLQNNVSGINDKQLLQDLNIAGIDSWLSHELKTFYKR